MTNIYDKIANLSPEKRKLLEQKLKQKNSLPSNNITANTNSKLEKLTLSSGQLRMWLLNQFEPGNPAYNRPTNFKITGEIDIKVLRQSLNKIIERHEVLRISFPIDSDGIAVQKIHASFQIELPVIDLSNLSKTEQEVKVKKLAINAAKHTFDLSKLPLIRTSLLKLNQNEQILLLNFHHIIFDGWSAEILLTELKTFYDSFINKKLSSIPELSIQYADFAIWQQQQLKNGVFNDQLAYWKKQLHGELPVLNLPKDRPRGAEQTFNGSKVELILNSEITQALKDFSLQENVTLYMTLLAAFKVLLYKYTSQEDIIIGSPIAGRDRAETEPLIGIFINTLAIRSKINPDLTFEQFLAEIKQTVLEAQSNKDVPLEKVIETLNIKRNLSHSSVFQILFQLRNIPQANFKNESLCIEKLELDLEIIMLDLSLEIETDNQELKCVFKYNKDLFNVETIRQISQHFKILLLAVVSNAEANISIKNISRSSTIANLSQAITSLIETDAVIEARLINILQDILAIENIDVNDNIIELGIDSLSAIRLVSHISQQMQTEIKINTIFQYPTAAELGKEIQKLKQDRSFNKANYNNLSSIKKYNKNYFSCCLIGEQAFIYECAKKISKNGHKITGIISTGDLIKNWANSNDLAFIEPTKDILSFLKQQSFDYLFSIYNLTILSHDVIKLANKATINCHDALLPQYGGIHATSWAILNQEKTHGVTWHLVNDKIDEGDIILQKEVSLLKNETAFTLNNKCYQEIQNSFSQLIDSLANDEFSATPQNLANKSYYYASEKPSTGCLLSFNQSAAEIDAFIRSLDFGIYPNYLGLPKIFIDKDFIIVSEIEILSKSSLEEAGKIVSIQQDFIQISTTTNDIKITEVKSILGEILSVESLVKKYNLTVGYKFTKLQADLLTKIKNTEKKSFVKEKFWLNKIAKFKAIKLPHTTQSLSKSQKYYTWKIPNEVFDLIKSNHLSKCDLLFTIFSCYLVCISENNFDLGYTSYQLQNKVSGIDKLFAATVPFRINFDLNSTLKEALDYWQQEIISVEKNQTYSKDIFFRHSLKQIPEFSVVLDRANSLDNYKKNQPASLIFAASKEDNYCYLVYNEQQFTRENILQFGNSLTAFTKNVLNNSEDSLTQTFLPYRDRTQNFSNHIKQQKTLANLNQGILIHQLFENQADKTPSAVAIRFEEKLITYQELNYRANQLARYLQKIGVKEESIVGIYLPKSINLIISLLAILKSGAAYLPLDTKYPSSRIEYITKDARITALITTKEFSNICPNIETNILYLDTLKPQLFKHNTANLDLPIEPHNLAYIIYTSGSTGKPKGVAIEHHSLVNFVESAIAKYQITHNDNILQFSSIGFDAAVEEIYTCLTTGATLVLRTEEMLSSTAKFIEQCQNKKITVLDLPTAYWHQITEDITTTNISLSPFLRLVIIGGEKVLPNKVALWQQYTGGYPELINTYGPTEGTVVTTTYNITPNTSTDIDIPIGKPLVNVECYILDDHLQPLPIGVPGELYISGEGVARGYLNRPELTAEKFIPNPTPLIKGGRGDRLYKTGDKALRLADGNIQFLGRIDNQVKIRGFRVELGEIEATLQNYSLIKDVVVISIEVNPGDLRLVAYFVPLEANQVEIDDIRNYVVGLLPEYAIPSAFIPLETFPITVNGKIDKQSLPTPEWQTKQKKDNFIVSTTSVEIELTRIWQNVLQQEQISTEDDFFAIGGHSLLAVQVSNQIAQKLKIDISLKKIFEYPTIKQLSREIEKLSLNNPKTATLNTSVETELIKIWQDVLQQPVSVEDDFFAIGGHSLLAVQVSNQIAQKLKIDISLKKIFEYPTIKQLSQQIENLTVNKNDTTTPVSSPNPFAEKIPLSFAQIRLWFLEQLEPGKITYTIPFALSITGALNIAALEASLNQIVKRHEVLRTSFITVEGKPQQIIEPYAAIDIPLINLRQYSEAEAKTQARKIIYTFKKETFDLTSAPLIKAKLLCLSQNEHWLFINIHHIAFDGWSQNIFNRELSALYSAYCNNRPLSLAPLTTQYADFARWQRQYLEQDQAKQQLNYWRNQLAGDLPRLKLPTDYPRPQTISYKGTREIFSLNSQLTARLKQLSQKQHSTLFMTFLTAFQVLLHRYTSQTDIIIGTPMAERNQPETADLIGFFINTLVLRSQINPESSFTHLLKQVKETALSAYENKDIPFDKLVEELAPQRDSRYTPLFHVCFVMQGISKGLELENLEITPLKFKSETAKFDLSLSIRETTTGIDGAIVYSTDLFKSTTIKRMVNNFQTLLEAIVAQPDKAINQLPLLTQLEKQQILVNWNNTQTDYPQKAINELFEIQVTKTPNAVALIYEEQQLTYQQLNRKANHLARYLQNIDTKSRDTVGIFLERSVESIIALLAILKIGGVYLPLDITYPQERIDFMLSESKIQVVITNAYLSANLQNYSGERVYIDKDWTKITRQLNSNLDIKVQPDDLAYIMYTSGSTGKPKGVCVKHRGVVRLVKNTNYASLDSQQVFLQLAPMSFDAATLEIWGSLLNGAKLILYPERTITLEKLEQVIHQHQITILWLTAALFNLIVDENITALQPVKQLLTGGDVLSVSHVQKALSTLDNCQLTNCYGPTENTTFTSYYRINQLDSNAISIPIGKPIANTQVYILDKHLQPVPVGIVGELYIAGDGLAQGYWNRPQLNQERFINNPFVKNNSSLLYKTGDLVRYRDDSNIEFIGRIDNQVKIRGYRIELAEIETALTKHPQIKNAVVLAKETASGDKNLVAYIISKEQNPISQELRQFLGNKLPNYMIPANYLFLKQFPLSPNGKVQRTALLKSQCHNSAAIEHTSPRNEIEIKLAQIWQELLDIPSINVTDDFFALGGNSLLSIALIAAVEKVFQQKIPVSTFFGLSTIEQLANAIALLQTTTNPSTFIPNSDALYQLTEKEYSMLLASTVPEKRVLSDRSLITLEKPGNPQVRTPLFFVYLLGDLAQHLPSDLPVYKLNLATTVIERPETYIKALATHYVQEIRKIQPQGKYYIGGYCVGGHVALEIARQLKAQKQEVANLILVETATFNPVYLHYQSLIAQLGYRVWLKFLTRAENLQGASFERKMALLQEISRKLPTKIRRKIAPQPITNYPEPTVEMKIRHVLKLAMRGYRFDAYYGKATLLLARRSTLHSPIFPLAGWKKFFKREFNSYLIPGDHVTINEGENAVLLARYINNCLD